MSDAAEYGSPSRSRAIASRSTACTSDHEHILFAPFTEPDRSSVLDVEPERVAVQTAGGEIVERRSDPRSSYPMPFEPTTPWDALQVAYFTSYAVWNYLTTPFLLTYPSVEARETEAWQEDGETWRRLKVTFPKTIATHNPDQVFYFDADYMLRRLDYHPDVTNAPIAHYVSDQKEFDGFIFPTRRHVYLRKEGGTADKSLAAITIDIQDVAVS